MEPEETVPFVTLVHSEFGSWSRRALLLMMVLMMALVLLAIHKLDRNYNGNPSGGSRQLLCALIKDDAVKDPEVAAVEHEFC